MKVVLVEEGRREIIIDEVRKYQCEVCNKVYDIYWHATDCEKKHKQEACKDHVYEYWINDVSYGEKVKIARTCCKCNKTEEVTPRNQKKFLKVKKIEEDAVAKKLYFLYDSRWVKGEV